MGCMVGVTSTRVRLSWHAPFTVRFMIDCYEYNNWNTHSQRQRGTVLFNILGGGIFRKVKLLLSPVKLSFEEGHEE